MTALSPVSSPTHMPLPPWYAAGVPPGRHPPMSDHRQPLCARLPDAGNVLLLAPERSDATDRACVDLLTPADPGEEGVLSVSFTRSPAEQVAAWERHASGYPAAAAFVSSLGAEADVGTAIERVRDSVPASTAVAVDRLGSPGELLKLGVRVSARFDEWHGRHHRIVMCVNSLTTLAKYVALERHNRFLHVLTRRVKAVHGLAHYHLDPGTLEPATVTALTALFDATVELEPDGEARVRP